jgi:hypothetical protein
VNASRRICLAIGLSLLAHASLLLVKPLVPDFKPPGPLADVPMTVTITLPEPPPEPPPVAREPPPPAPRPAPRKVEPRPPRVATAPTPPLPAPEPAELPPPVAEAPRSVPPPPVDMLAMIEERRAARRAQEAQAAPKVEAPTEDAATRNLRTLTGREGVGGVFQVLRIGPCSGEFAFNGWRPDARSQWREVIEVESRCGDTELTMVKRMIDLIRTHYSGDFHWESHRLQRVIVLSARPEDQRRLEDFLMVEFFGQALENPRSRMR